MVCQQEVLIGIGHGGLPVGEWSLRGQDRGVCRYRVKQTGTKGITKYCRTCWMAQVCVSNIDVVSRDRGADIVSSDSNTL